MSKGFNNFMSKKGFHPGSYANRKRIQEAEEKAAAKRKHDEDTLIQYQKEQELFQQKALVSRESKDKLSLSFMYEPPPGTSKQGDGQGTSTSSSTQEIKWNREKPIKIKEEHKLEQKSSTSQAKSNDKKNTIDSDDDEPKISLTWQRTESRTKKTAPNQPKFKEEPDTKRVKKER